MNIDGIALHELHLEDLQNPLHPSSYEEHGNYRVLILLLPEKIKRRPQVRSYGFMISGTAVYRYDRERGELEPLPEGLYGMHRILDEKIDPIMDDIDKVTDKIAALEESLYRKVSSGFMEKWHGLKKEFTRSELLLRKAVDVLERFILKTRTSERFPLNEFNDLHEHLERTLRSMNAANTQLDNLYHFYNLHSTDRLNRSIYVLTVISVIFLPLNLVVGFFGMNTGGLPFQDHSMGTAYAFITMIVFAAFLALAVLWKIKNE